MQEYKLIDKFDGYKLLDKNNQVIYVQTDDVKKQLSLGNVRIYGLKLSESGRLFKETSNQQWENNIYKIETDKLFRINIDEFLHELGLRSKGTLPETFFKTNKQPGIQFNHAYNDKYLSEKCIIEDYDSYKHGIVLVYDPEQKGFVRAEYYMALANKIWHDSILSGKTKSKQSLIEMIEKQSSIIKDYNGFELTIKPRDI